MARCGNCGKANREGALFCQDCGQPLDERLPDGSVEQSGPNGARAQKRSVPAVAVAAGESGDTRAAARIACPQCSQPTPAGFAFCQHCGTRMQGSSDALAHVPASPAASPRSSRADLPVLSSAEIRPPRTSNAPTASGPPPAAPPSESLPEPPRSPRPTAASAGLRGRLVLLRRDGSDGEVLVLHGETFDIGRSEGSRCFTDDVYMAPRHARFLVASGGVRVRPLDMINGVFLQIHEPFELQSSDVFYIGRELIRFEMLASEERDPPPAFEHGVRLFGSTQRESWGRLRQLTSSGTTRDLWHLCRTEVRIGREEGDIVFPDDEFMSRRHAVLSRHGNRVRLEDQHSSNGTYVRLRGDRDLQANDVLRIGDQVLRFEL